MRENEFEKGVQQKMKAFNLHPSAEVWMQVERRIRRERKRRFIFWWPLAFLLAGGGIAAGILLTGKKEKTGKVTVANETIRPAAKNTTTSTSVKPAITQGDGIILRKDNNTQGSKEITEKIKAPATKDNTRKIGEEWSKTTTPVTKKAITNKEIIINDPGSTKQPGKDQDKETIAKATTPSAPVNPLQEPRKTTNVSSPDKQDLTANTVQQHPVPLTNDSVSREKKDKPADKKSKNWDWGITLAAGRSSIVNKFGFISSSRYYSAPLTGSPATGGTIPSSFNLRPHISFSTGLFAERALSKKLALRLGFGYSFLSTRMTVGNRVDSVRSINNYYSNNLTVNSFYRPGGQSSYTNGYHLLSLSGDISWRIISGKKIKISWENGVSYQRLLTSTMLHYDGNPPGLYKDNSAVTKNHLFISTGLSFPVGNRWSINPFAMYSLTPVLNRSDTLHFRNYGLRVRFLLNKK